LKNKVILLALSALALGACTRVDPGHVGVKVNRYGSGAGVQEQALGVGTYQTMFGVDIYEYPIYTSTHAWAGEETFSFQDRSGLIVSGDVSVAYRVDPVKAPVLFQKYRTDMEGIVNGPLRNAVRSALVEAASNMTVEEIYGPGKTVLINKALQTVRAYFEPFGLHVEQLYWAGSIQIPETILNQINMKIKNEQEALAAEANVATVEANSRARIAEARGLAEATEIEAAALRANPEILKQRAIETWNGELPQYLGSQAPIPFLSN